MSISEELKQTLLRRGIPRKYVEDENLGRLFTPIKSAAELEAERMRVLKIYRKGKK